MFLIAVLDHMVSLATCFIHVGVPALFYVKIIFNSLISFPIWRSVVLFATSLEYTF